MTSISLQLPDELSQRLHELAQRTGHSETFHMIAAIRDHLDDLEDRHIAEQRLSELGQGRSRTYTLAEVERDLGLED